MNRDEHVLTLSDSMASFHLHLPQNDLLYEQFLRGGLMLENKELEIQGLHSTLHQK
jgi:hypothetical protein